MKIALVSSKHSDINPLPLIAKNLVRKIAGVQVVQKMALSNLDIPAVLSSLKGCDLIVVALYYHDETLDVKVAMEKLVDLDLKGQQTMKFIELSENHAERGEAKRIYRAILEKLFGIKAPEEKG